MKTNQHTFLIAAGLFALGWMTGCEAPKDRVWGDSGAEYGMNGYVGVGTGSVGVGVGVGYYDPWYYGGAGYPPAAVVGPPVGAIGVGMGPRPR
jgi:hypothetical protein